MKVNFCDFIYNSMMYAPHSTPTGPRIRGFELTYPIDRIVKNVIQMGPNFISPEINEEHVMCWSKNK